MRRSRFLASSIGITCAAALALSMTLLASATASTTPAERTAAVPTPIPGTTQSLPLAPRGADRGFGSAAVEQGLGRRDVRSFSLVGVVWDDPDAELQGRVQVRTRAKGTSSWSGWQDVETHNHEHAADPDTAEWASGRVRGSTAPLWVGESDGVEVRVRAEARRRTAAPGEQMLPDGLRLELVDPGSDVPGDATDAPDVPDTGGVTSVTDATGATGATGVTDAAGVTDPAGVVSTASTASAVGTPSAVGTASTASPVGAAGPAVGPPPVVTPVDSPRLAALTAESVAASAVNADLAPLGATVIPALSREETEARLAELEPGSKPYIGPRPQIVTRRGWGADEKLRERDFLYTERVQAAFVHHTASGNNYRCAQAPTVIRSIYRYHVVSSGWRDIGYNFLIDKCGNIYEGRAGGVAKPVMGAHTLGFNKNSMGIAVLGSFTSTMPSDAAVRAIAQLTAWKLGLYRANPNGKTYLTSGGGNLYRKGKKVRLNVISGHRDGFATECPGGRLYGKLGAARSEAAHYQGR
nr:peptidoglycan recognition protein [Streptomyces ipomoeae]